MSGGTAWRGLWGLPLVLHPQRKAPPGAELGTAERGFTSTLWPATASLTPQWQPGTRPPFTWSHTAAVTLLGLLCRAPAEP